FKNTALLAGAALSPEGAAKSSMGIDAGDFDNDGDEDLFITELTGQGHDLYVNDGAGSFDERSARSGIRLASLPFTGFGAGWIDMVVGNDNGQLRLFINNVGSRKHWVGLTVPVGARVAVTASDGRTLWRRAHTDGSYASARDPRVLVGLGDAAGPVKVRVIV